MENDESKKVSERLLNNRYNKPQNDGLTHLMLTAEDRVRVKKYDSKENFLPVYNDRIEEDKDEDNYTSNFDSPGNQKKGRKTIVVLPGNALELIKSYFGDEPTMHLLCRGIRYKMRIHNGLEIQQQIPFPEEEESVETPDKDI